MKDHYKAGNRSQGLQSGAGIRTVDEVAHGDGGAHECLRCDATSYGEQAKGNMEAMRYREEAIECVKDYVLQLHKQIYAKYNGDFDRIYTEGYNNKSYAGRVIEPGMVYELSYLECTCPKVKCGLRNHPQQCECSRQSILHILSQLEPDSHFEVRIENTILRGSDRCTFRITRHEGY